ncbi:hypothetical protein [Microbispora bryophytorum]|uniref:hypothetical protein n=1 Tax=Microbispora bryophytorum TaxID=1460882 RepID=UPI0034009E2D
MHRISGLTPDQERLYRYLLGTGRLTMKELVTEFGDKVLDDLHELTLRGLALGDPPIPRRPSEALKGAIEARQAQLQAIENYIADLDRLYDSVYHPPFGVAVQVLTSRTAIQRAYEEIHTTAEEEVMQLITHPFLPLTDPSSLDDTEDPEHKTRCRVICEWRVFENKQAVRGLRHSSERGCEVRLSDRLPHKLLIGDRRVAMTPRFPRGHRETRQMLLVHPGTLLDFLVEAFETEWERALPLQPDPGRFAGEGLELDGHEMVILDMLSRGNPVDRIASALSVHTRTVNRRLDELKRRAGVSTLFQLGAHAARYWMVNGLSGSEDS